MIEIKMDTVDLSRIRFAYSPLWETITSIRTLQNTSSNALHLRWVRSVRDQLHDIDLEFLFTLVPPDGYIPDFLTPAPPRRTQSFTSGLELIAATPHSLVRAELAQLRGTQLLLQDPAKTLDRITTELERYWTIAIEPYWTRIRAVSQADLAFRMEQLSEGGLEQLLNNLHPWIAYDGRVLRIRKPHCGQSILGGRGLLLVPCVFTWPKAMVLTAEPYTPTISYFPRGVGTLWDTPAISNSSPVADLLGRTRAAILEHLDLPMTTTQLSGQLGLTAPTLSSHLQILKAAGVVQARREGRAVLYDRTKLGKNLLTGTS